jgi:4'-phosphopantetheinyl transferase
VFNENLTLPFLVSLDEIPHLWQHSDALIFLVDLNDYDTLNTGYLSSIELESLARLKTSYFKRRYIISRTVLKRILCKVTGERSASGISTYKDRNGRVCILNNSELYICISYTESVAVLAVSKVEIGIDIELEKKLALKSNLKDLSMKLLSTDEPISDTDLLKIWTLKEAYSKFSNNKMHLIFNKELDLSSVNYRTFILNEKYILSVITSSKSHTININRLHRIDFNYD